jgi:hypothetical protein
MQGSLHRNFGDLQQFVFHRHRRYTVTALTA